MQEIFSLKLLKHGTEEGILIVFLNSQKKPLHFFANVLSFNRLKNLSKELQDKNQKYFYKKNLLIVHDLSLSNLKEIVEYMESSGDLFEIMQPMSFFFRLSLQWKIWIRHYFH